jgi:HSP20 family protein
MTVPNEGKSGQGGSVPRAVGRTEDQVLKLSWTPYVDVAEREGQLTISVELPGVSLDDVSVALCSNVLIVRGLKREAEIAAQGVCYHCVERDYGKFYREIGLPWVADVGSTRAVLRHGILRITLHCMEERRGQTFEIPVVS